MKKLILILSLFIFSTQAQAQDNLAGGRLGFTTMINFAAGGASAVMFGPGFFYQRSLGSNVAVGLNFDFHFGTYTLINIEPRIDYFPKATFDGFHIGSKIGILSTLGGAGINLGVNLGYMFQVANNLKIDLGFAPGMSFAFAGGGGSLSLIPVAGIGYAF